MLLRSVHRLQVGTPLSRPDFNPSGMSSCRAPARMSSRPEHRTSAIDTIIYHVEIVVFGEHMFIDNMHSSFLWGGTFSIAFLNKAGVLDIKGE